MVLKTSIWKLDSECTIHFFHIDVVHISFIKRIWLDSGFGPFLFWAVSGVVSLLLAVVTGDMIDVFLGFHIWTVVVVRSIVSVSLTVSIASLIMVPRRKYTPHRSIYELILPLLRTAIGIVSFIIAFVARQKTYVFLLRADKVVLIYLFRASTRKIWLGIYWLNGHCSCTCIKWSRLSSTSSLVLPRLKILLNLVHHILSQWTKFCLVWCNL